nr:MAG TPA: hypothetical protein [Caudoviricetes sp.]DAO32109.1 MAG TPA: hypothetical protein [Caudoviricetes sp.]
MCPTKAVHKYIYIILTTFYIVLFKQNLLKPFIYKAFILILTLFDV